MPLNFNNKPYFDDYNPLKEFYKILFKTGQNVQVRELNQLQSILNNQISNFGKYVFQPGSMVLPGAITYDQNLAYVQLNPTYAGAQINYNLIDPTIVPNVQIQGVTTGLIAQVIQVASDINTLYIKYVNSGTNNTTAVFAAGEVLKVLPLGTNICQAVSANATGLTASASISNGIYFIFGEFVSVLSQTIRLADYSQTPSVNVGLEAIENIITSQQDPSLFDNALGTPNYTAPGADRYQIVLKLTSLPAGTTPDSEFTSLMVISNGVIQSQVTTSVLSQLNDTLAQRTYDANGNFIVKPFGFDLHEDLLNGNNGGIYTAGEGGEEYDLALGVEPGKGYVDGYSVQTISKQYVTLEKARTTNFAQNAHTRAYLGNYVYINRLYGVPLYNTLPQAALYSGPIISDGNTPSGVQIGTATLRGLQFYEGTFQAVANPGPIFQCFLSDINITTTGKSITDVRSFIVSDSPNITANVLTQVDIVNVVGSFFSGSYPTTITDGTHIETVYVWDTNNNLILTLPTTTSISVNSPITAVANSANIGTANILQRIGLFDTSDNILIYNLPQNVVKSVRDQSSTPVNLTTYSVRTVFPTASATSGSVTFNAPGGQVFSPVDITDYVAVIETGTPIGTLINVANATPTFNSGFTQLTFQVPSTAIHIRLSATMIQSTGLEKSKTLTAQNIKVSSPTKFINLGRADVYAITGVFIGTDNTGQNITSWYTFDNGQRDNRYDFGSLTLLPGYTSPSNVYIEYLYFVHNSGDYFTVNSYVNFDSALPGYIANVTYYPLIPTYNGTDGNTYSLRDCFDFRPRVNDSASLTGTLTGSSYSSILFPPTYGTVGNLVVPNEDIIADFSYYLARIDKLYLNPQGQFIVLEGTPSLNPAVPADPSSGMVIAILSYPAYTFTPNSVGITIIPNKVYTMSDIGNLEKRITNLEYYTALNLLEQQTANMQIPDAVTGLNRYQAGFVVDNFIDNSVADYTNPDCHYSLDAVNKTMRPTYYINSINMNFDAADSSNFEFQALKPNNNVLTLPYSEAAIVTQNMASRQENLNPYNIFQFIGNISLTPATDTWISITYLPDITVTDNSYYAVTQADALATGANILGTIWNAWTTDWVGTPVTTIYNVTDPAEGGPYIEARTTQQIGQSQTGTKTFLVANDTTTVNDVQVSTGIVPYCRPNTINFVAQGLKPSTQFWPFFDITPIGAYCTPAALISDSHGQVSGTFNLPDPSVSGNPAFRTGTRVFQLCNDPNQNTSKITSYATANYVASGVLDTDQQTITSVDVPEVQTQNVSQTAVSTQTISDVFTWLDPLAQSFLVNTLQGGYCATSVNLFFASADPTIPVTLQIREMLNGTPTQTIVPFSTVVLNPSSINVSTNATAATNFPFTSPVYLQQGVEYALVLISNSNQYNVWCAQLGDNVLNSSSLISQVPYAGLLFKSQNASTWVPSPGEALKFVLNRAVFDYNVLGEVLLENPVIPTVTLPNLSVNTFNGLNTIEILQPNHGMPSGSFVTISIPPGTTTVVLSSNTGTFLANEIVTGQTSGATATVTTWTSGTETLVLNNLSAAFTIGEILKGGTSGATGPVSTASYANWNLSFNGINVSTIIPTVVADIRSSSWDSITANVADTVLGSRTYIINNPRLDLYTINIVNGSGVVQNASSSGLTGVGFNATQNYAYDVMMPIVNELNFSGTNTNYYMRAITETSVDGSQVPYNYVVTGSTPVQFIPSVQFIPNQNVTLTSPQMVASGINELKCVNKGNTYNNKSLVWLINLISNCDNLSPMIDTTRSSALLISNRIDYRTSNTITLTGITGSGYVINESITTPGATGIVLSYISPNLVIGPLTGTFIVGAVVTGSTSGTTGTISVVQSETGSVSYNSATSPLGATPTYVSEMVSGGTTDEAVYITSPVVLATAANSIHFWLNLQWPANGAQVDVYYKILPIGSGVPFASQPWFLMTPNTSFSPSPNGFSQYYWKADYIPSGSFNTFAVKVVMRSINSSTVPLCQQLICIALET